jgi:hypothetical protein
MIELYGSNPTASVKSYVGKDLGVYWNELFGLSESEIQNGIRPLKILELVKQ